MNHTEIIATAIAICIVLTMFAGAIALMVRSHKRCLKEERRWDKYRMGK